MAHTTELLIALAAFAVWTLASFFCHMLAKKAMGIYVDADDDDETSSVPFLHVAPLVVTLIQALCCYVTVKTTLPKADKLLYNVTVASHVLATFATNASLALTHASSALAIKMLEPVTSAVLQSCLMKTPVGPEAAGGMALAVAGAVLYVGNPLRSANDSRAVLMAVISNLTLSVRNVTMKLSHNASSSSSSSTSTLTSSSSSSSGSSAAIRLRYLPTVLSFYVCANIVVLLVRILPKSAAAVDENVGISGSDVFSPDLIYYFLLLALASGKCHVIYSYVSTNVVLRYTSVVSHALANISKRVLVVLLLHVSGRRAASPWNWAGLALCTLGMLLYYRKKIAASSQSQLAFFESRHPDKKLQDESTPERPNTSRIRARQLFWILVPIVMICGLGMLPAKNEIYYKVAPGHEENSSFRVNVDAGRSDWTERVSPVLTSNPRIQEKSETDYALNLRFGYANWTDGKPLITGPTVYQPDRKSRREIEEFLSRDHLIETPFDTDTVSPYLTTAREVIDEHKRIHFNLFRDLLRGKKYAVLFELASFENKGDSAISLGELVFIENMGIKLVSYVNVQNCPQNIIEDAIKAAEKYPKEEVVMLFHGGGNLIARSNVDRCRHYSLPLTSGYQQLMFTNSIWMKDNKYQFDRSRKLFCCNPNLTVLIRDRLSLQIAQRIFNGGTRFILAPDMAIHIGYVGRHIAPYYDIIWQKRSDLERALFDSVPKFPSNVSTFVWDWRTLMSIPDGNSIKMLVNVVRNGFGILQQGKVLVTDRLHGHIMSTLLDIPHVLLDNADRKLSSFHNTWTRGLKNCRLADNAEDAARLALELLEEYKDTLPKRLTAVEFREPKQN